MGWIDMHCDTLSGILMGERGGNRDAKHMSLIKNGLCVDVERLGSNAVVVLYVDVDDDSLIKLLDEYPRELDMPRGRIMYSTLEPMDDDYDMI